jgi:tRNA modification GTPase
LIASKVATDTIVAVATAPGRGAIGVVRLSGPGAVRIGEAIAGKMLVPRTAVYARFRGTDGEVVDEGLAIAFPAPRSYTGEDVVELQGHGGEAVLGEVLGRCVALGARLAEPGEFTRRAFLNGKLDLAQAESVADLIESKSAAAARSALRSLRGEFSDRIGALHRGLVELRALAEAALDFPDEGDVEVMQTYGVAERLRILREQVAGIRRAAQQGALLREGVKVAIVGAPNVGKSSLLNRLAGEEVAIVTAVPGTTRDVLRANVALEGIPFEFFDTAGLRDSGDPVEAIGIDRGRRAALQADLVIRVVESGASVAGDVPFHQVEIENKIDLTGIAPGVDRAGTVPRVRISALTGAGLDQLRATLLDVAGWKPPQDEGVFMARARHLRALDEAAERLAEAAALGAQRQELFAEELRYALDALASIVGSTTADDLLGEIFSRFCIGK